jgi:UPF0716 family protein affecting phage T7 exclusion
MRAPDPAHQPRVPSSWPFWLMLWAEAGLFAGAIWSVGFWPVLAWTCATGALGALLLLRGGSSHLSALLELWQAPTGGARGLALARAHSGDILLRTLGAFALLMPGLLTDALGLALCLPAVRRQLLVTTGHRGPQRVRQRREVRDRPPTGEWRVPPPGSEGPFEGIQPVSPRSGGARVPTARVEVLPPEVAPHTPFDDSAPVVIEVRPSRRADR